MKLHTGDTVLVISGKDRGKTGTVLRVMRDDGRVVVAGVNMHTRHFKKAADQPGRIVKFEASLSASNVMILDPKTKKPSRIGFTVDAKGNKKRIAKLSGEAVVHVRAAKVAKKVKETKEEKESKETKEKTPLHSKGATEGQAEIKAPGAKQPFWKKMGFGAAALEEAEVPEGAHSQKDQSIPAQELHVRKGGRGT